MKTKRLKLYYSYNLLTNFIKEEEEEMNKKRREDILMIIFYTLFSVSTLIVLSFIK